MSALAFSSFILKGADAQKFLQGQVTLNVEQLPEDIVRYTGICSLKGRLEIGLWLKKINTENFELVTTKDQSDTFIKHIRKYGAFSKIELKELGEVFPYLLNHHTQFSTQQTDLDLWQQQAIESGQAWICKATEHAFQPQELRLHQREGVHYNKGCYLGQEIVARLWFKAKPKHWLHLILGTGEPPAPSTQLNKDIEVVNSIAVEQGYKALVVAKPSALEELGLRLLDLPEYLNGDVARPQ